MVGALRLVIITYSPGGFLETMLATVPPASRRSVAVTVVDNGSTDGTVEYVEARPELTLAQPGCNAGYGAGANVGVAGASEPWVIVANPDITFAPRSVDLLLDAAERWPGAGVIGPCMLTPDGRVYPSARELPSLGRGIGHAVFGWMWPTNPWTARYRREREEPREGIVGWLSGACMLVRREAFESVGGFDESYFMYFEDTDLCERLAKAGWEVVYAPDAVVEHHGGHSTSRELMKMSKAHHDSAYRYLSRRYAGPVWVPLRAVLKAGLWGRYQVSRRVNKVVHGAQPTRAGSSVAQIVSRSGPDGLNRLSAAPRLAALLSWLTWPWMSLSLGTLWLGSQRPPRPAAWRVSRRRSRLPSGSGAGGPGARPGAPPATGA